VDHTPSLDRDRQAPPVVPRRTTVTWLLLPLRLAYGLYAGTVFTACALLALVPLAFVPTLAGRRRLVRRVGRTVLALAGMPVHTHWHAPLPDPCIVVANHCSYLDGVVLCAVLPPRFDFVIKREMDSVPLAAFLLNRIGVQFVQRGNRAGSLRDALRVMRSAAGGRSLAFFPEGTFEREPALLRFHTGAFAAAERAGAPVVPLVLRGTRHCLPPGSFLPSPGRIEVRTLPVLVPVAGDADGAARLRDAAHAAILAALDESEVAQA
jgi:1-acyl-sn-glycerol-3-phosphate acyltransferase